jgi:L-iditol 2-dehydrogenase
MVEMKACGLCGTDIEKMHGEYTNAMPVLGHEAVGVVVALGEGVAGMKEGDRVFPHHHVPCYQCYYCRHGSETMCADYRTSNLDPGGFSERFRVPAWIVNKGGVLILPPQVRDEEATMIEPVACCIRALSQCAAVACDSVLVVGAGPVGMSHALLLNSMKVRVMISDVSRPRLQFAEQAGVGSVFYAGETDIPSAVKNETAGRGADLAIVASGSQRALTQALKSVRRGGVVCLFGIPVVSTVFEGSISDLYNSNVSIIPSYGAVESDTAKALDVMARKAVEFGSLITHKFPLDKFDQAVEAAVSGQAMKVVLTP